MQLIRLPAVLIPAETESLVSRERRFRSQHNELQPLFLHSRNIAGNPPPDTLLARRGMPTIARRPRHDSSTIGPSKQSSKASPPHPCCGLLALLRVFQGLRVLRVGDHSSAHRGVTTMTRWPRRDSAIGRLPTTSPRPPVLLQGPARMKREAFHEVRAMRRVVRQPPAVNQVVRTRQRTSHGMRRL